MSSTVPLKRKLTLETRTSRLDPRASMLETFEDRVSSIESRVSSIEKQGFLEYANTRKGFEETIYFLKEEQYGTAHTYSKVQVFRVDRYRMKTFDQKIAD